MTRPATVPPIGVVGWLKELLSIAAGVTAVGAIAYACHVFYMRKSVARVETADCQGDVVFVEGDQRWRFNAQGDCERFRIGDRWIISWNLRGRVLPVRRR